MPHPTDSEKSFVKRFRPWSYAIVRSEHKVVLVEKMRGPFTGLYDLPGGGIDHGEKHLDAVIRELEEEIWLRILPQNLSLHGIFTHVVEYAENDAITSLHMLGIVFELPLEPEIFSDVASGKTVGTEAGGDAGKRLVLDLEELDGASLTPICREALRQLRNILSSTDRL